MNMDALTELILMRMIILRRGNKIITIMLIILMHKNINNRKNVMLNV